MAESDLVSLDSRLEFPLADSVAFDGAEAKPRVFTGVRVCAAVQPPVRTLEFMMMEASISETGSPVLNIAVCPQAGERLTRGTAAHLGQRLLILSGNRVSSVAVMTDVLGDRVQVAGLETVAEAMALASLLQPRLRQRCTAVAPPTGPDDAPEGRRCDGSRRSSCGTPPSKSPRGRSKVISGAGLRFSTTEGQGFEP